MARDSLAPSFPPADAGSAGKAPRARRRRRAAPISSPPTSAPPVAGDDTDDEDARDDVDLPWQEDADASVVDDADDLGHDDEDQVSEPPAPRTRARRQPRMDPGSHVGPAEAEHVTAPETPEKKQRKKPVTKAKSKPSATVISTSLSMDILGIGACALGLLLLLALVSYHSNDTALGAKSARGVANWIGPGGALVADLLTLTLGLVAYAVPPALFFTGWSCFRPNRLKLASLRGVGFAASLLGLMMLLHLVFRSSTWLPYPGGGLLGALVFDQGSRVLAPIGTSIVATALFLVGGLVGLDRPLGKTALQIGERVQKLWRDYLERAQVWREEQRLLREERDALIAEVDEEAVRDQAIAEEKERAERVKLEARKRARVKIVEIVETPPAPEEVVTAPPPALPLAVAVVEAAKPAAIAADPAWATDDDANTMIGMELPMAAERPRGAPLAGFAGQAPPLRGAPLAFAKPVFDDAVEPDEIDDGPLKIVERALPDAATILAAAAAVVEEPAQKSEYQLPPLNLLDYDAPQVEAIDEGRLHVQAQKLVAKFKDFGIDGRIREIRPGPVVTTYEFVPAPGIKVSKIAALSDDIAMAMEAVHVRIVAPIPGKGAVGIELPNEKRETVFMKEIIADPAFQKRKDDKLLMALGKDIEGRCYYANLAEMPHLLIAGTTGSGKSVAVNAMICSLLYRATPEDVKFLMIDPKMLELSIYEGIPHLLLPPIIDSKKAANALKWAVNEMEKRYQIMSELGVRDIAGFNARLAAAKEGNDPEAKTKLVDAQGKPLAKLPWIVIIIDEYADLLAVAGKDVEGYVMRLAQKARAAGLHVMLATQRPSVDVITGVIKANFPVRMGFRLASNHDSKTVINRPGAEKLLGRGDMLFMPPGTSNVCRVHGAYISEKELHRVVDFLKSQGKPNYDMSILTPPLDEEGEDGAVDEEKDERYEDAITVVGRTRKCSTSWLQRQLGIGYNRSARIVEMMERNGLVGPVQNAKGDREIFIAPAK